MFDFQQLWDGIKQVGFPVAMVVYLLYITQTTLKELTSKVIELDAFIRAKLGGG